MFFISALKRKNPINITFTGFLSGTSKDKTSLDIFWLKDKSLTVLDNLLNPYILASEIIENIEAGLQSFREIMETINSETE